MPDELLINNPVDVSDICVCVYKGEDEKLKIGYFRVSYALAATGKYIVKIYRGFASNNVAYALNSVQFHKFGSIELQNGETIISSCEIISEIGYYDDLRLDEAKYPIGLDTRGNMSNLLATIRFKYSNLDMSDQSR